jgi:hypothetical protein
MLRLLTKVKPEWDLHFGSLARAQNRCAAALYDQSPSGQSMTVKKIPLSGPPA